MQYSIGSKISNGRFASVYKVSKDGKKYAAKLLPKHRIDISDIHNKDMIRREIENHRFVNGHPNIVRLEDVVEDWGNYYIIQELCETDLQHVLDTKILCDEEKKIILKDCLKGIIACHEAGFIFGDLKPSNILISEKYKLCDFGSTDNVDGLYEGSSNHRGTPLYMAPEMVIYKKTHGKLIDMWALGMLAYVLFYEKYPYNIECTYKELIRQIRDVKISYMEKVSAGAEDFIRKCLEVDVYKRLTPQDALLEEFLQ